MAKTKQERKEHILEWLELVMEEVVGIKNDDDNPLTKKDRDRLDTIHSKINSLYENLAERWGV